MKELDVLERARLYIEKLSRGVDPLSDRPIPEGEVVRQERIVKCLTYVTGVLDREIGQQQSKTKLKERDKAPFALAPEQRKGLRLTVEPMMVTELARRINGRIDQTAMQKLPNYCITAWLLQEGFLRDVEDQEGRKARRPTDKGRALGISEEQRQREEESYWAILYDWKAQNYIVDHLEEIAALARQRRTLPEKEKQPWLPEEDAYPMEQYRRQIPISEIALDLKRKPTSVRTHLRKLMVPN